MRFLTLFIHGKGRSTYAWLYFLCNLRKLHWCTCTYISSLGRASPTGSKISTVDFTISGKRIPIFSLIDVWFLFIEDDLNQLGSDQIFGFPDCVNSLQQLKHGPLEAKRWVWVRWYGSDLSCVGGEDIWWYKQLFWDAVEVIRLLLLKNALNLVTGAGS